MATESPFFTVIIPTYARPARLKACLQAFTRLAYPRDRFELMVVDDGSPASMEPVVIPFAHALSVRLIRQENAGPAAARNAGAAHAQGSFLAFTDDDCAPDSGWLHALANRLKADPEQLVGGQTLNALPENPFSTTSQQLIAYLYDYYNERPGKARFFASNNMALSADCFHKVGGFSTRFPLAAGEDRDFCDCWRHAGYAMQYAPEAMIYHAHELTLRSFSRQHFNYGRGALFFHRARAQRRQQPLTPEPLSFYLDLLRFPFSQNRGRRAWLHATLMGVSQAANALGFFWEAFRHSGAPAKR